MGPTQNVNQTIKREENPVSITLTTENVLAALEAAVQEKGADYVYPRERDEYGYAIDVDSCLYVKNGAPSCLVGHALHSLGVPLEAMSNHEGAGANTVLSYLEDEGIVTFEKAEPDEDGYQGWSKVQTLVFYAQSNQDSGKTWGDSLDAARHEIGLVTA